MEIDLARITAYVAIAVPVTVAIGNVGKLLLQWLNQRHVIKTAVIEQDHKITTQYLDKALDPLVPLAIRHQLLRFLSTPQDKADRLQTWAKAELARIGNIIDEVNQEVLQAEKTLNAATTPTQVQEAERKLNEAIKNQKSLMEAPKEPEITAAALRAELIPDKKLNGLVMTKSDLQRMRLLYREVRSADFSESDLSNASLQGCDLRAALFHNSKLVHTTFYEADLRGADFSGATIQNSDFQKARLEGANFKDSIIKDSDLRATYDATTIWPSNFDPDKHGAVIIRNSNKSKVETKTTQKKRKGKN